MNNIALASYNNGLVSNDFDEQVLELLKQTFSSRNSENEAEHIEILKDHYNDFLRCGHGVPDVEDLVQDITMYNWEVAFYDIGVLDYETYKLEYVRRGYVDPNDEDNVNEFMSQLSDEWYEGEYYDNYSDLQEYIMYLLEKIGYAYEYPAYHVIQENNNQKTYNIYGSDCQNLLLEEFHLSMFPNGILDEITAQQMEMSICVGTR